MSNSPFLAPSRKHSHSCRSNTSTRPAGSAVTRISTHSPLTRVGSRTKATSMASPPAPERAQACASRSIPSAATVGFSVMPRRRPTGLPCRGAPRPGYSGGSWPPGHRAVEPPRSVTVRQVGVDRAPGADEGEVGLSARVGRLDLQAIEEPGDVGLRTQDDVLWHAVVQLAPALDGPPRLAVQGEVGQRQVTTWRERSDVTADEPPWIVGVGDEMHDRRYQQADRLGEVNELEQPA